VVAPSEAKDTFLTVDHTFEAPSFTKSKPFFAKGAYSIAVPNNEAPPPIAIAVPQALCSFP